MSELLISVSGVRGIVGEALTPDVIMRWVTAFAKDRGGGMIVVGTDGRRSGKMVKYITVGSLLASGCEVVDVGVAPTPSIALSVGSHRAAGAIAITASHNPAQYNALKFIGEQSLFLSDERVASLARMSEEGAAQYVDSEHIGSVFVDNDAVKRHVSRLIGLNAYDKEAVRKRGLRVAVDAVNASGSIAVPTLLRELGCSVVELNCTPTGLFPHDPEPRPDNIGALCEAVQQNSCDFGIAVDPDADRLCLVDESGRALSEEATLALCVKYVLSSYAGPVAVNLSTSRMIEEIASEFKAPVFRTRIGEAHVAQALIEREGVIGGEGNGGVILPASHYGRDALAAAYLIVGLLSTSDEPIGVHADRLPRWKMSKRKVSCTAGRADTIIKRLASELEGEKLDFTDGLRVERDTSWLHVRRSNTEPVVRVIAEARSALEAEVLCDTMAKRFG